MKNKIISILNSNVYLYGELLSCFLDNIKQIYEVLLDNILVSDYKNNLIYQYKFVNITNPSINKGGNIYEFNFVLGI